MLKACWDCIASDQRPTDDRYSVHMNGGSNAPPWQTPSIQNGTMFAVPTLLKGSNEIIVKGKMTDGMLDIGLRPDGNENNIVCQLHVVYPDNGQPHNQIVVRNVQDGNYNTFSSDINATDYFTDLNFEVRFQISPSAIRIFVGQSHLESVPLQHSMDDIRFISVRGEVQELGFLFNTTN